MTSITFKRLPLCPQKPKLQRFIVWRMISAKNLPKFRENIWLKTRIISIGISPIGWVMRKSWSFWFCSIQEVSDVLNIVTRNMSASIWRISSQDVYPAIVLWNWRRNSCYNWPFSSRRSCRVLVPASVSWILLRCAYAGPTYIWVYTE